MNTLQILDNQIVSVDLLNALSIAHNQKLWKLDLLKRCKEIVESLNEAQQKGRDACSENSDEPFPYTEHDYHLSEGDCMLLDEFNQQWRSGQIWPEDWEQVGLNEDDLGFLIGLQAYKFLFSKRG